MAEYGDIFFEDSSDSESDISSDSDDDTCPYPLPINALLRRDYVPRIENYDRVILKMWDKDFQSHFRLSRKSLDDVENMVFLLNFIF